MRGVWSIAALLVGACTFGSPGGSGGADGDDDSGPGTSTSSTDPTATSPSTASASATTSASAETGPTSGPSDDTTTTTTAGTATTESTSGTGEDSGSGTGEPQLPRGPFDAGQPLTPLNDPNADEDDPTLRGDLLEIVFNSTRNGTPDLFVSTRTTDTDPWDAPVPIVELNDAAYVETTPELSLDGLTMLFASDRPPSVQNDVWITTRPALDQPWTPPVRLPELSSDWQDFAPTVVDDQTMFFCSDRDMDTANLLDVWVVDGFDLRAPAFGSLTRSATFSTSSDDCSVAMSADGREILWETNRAGGMGDWDLWTATRDDPSAPWQNLAPVDNVNATWQDNDPWLSPDATQLYFASGFAADHDLFVAIRQEGE